MAPILVLVLAVAFVALSAVPGRAAGRQADPHAIIGGLYKRIYSIGETSGDLAKLDAAVAEATRAMRAYVAENAKSDALVSRNRAGMTPLIQAAFMGYSTLVEALLKSRKVVARINWLDGKGISAWAYANFAIRQSLLVCFPRATDHDAVWRPVAATAYYYAAYDPYRRTRALLEAAGAKTDVDQAKEQWTKLCPEQSAGLKQKVQRADDILDTLTDESATNFERTFTKDGELRQKSEKVLRRERLLRLGRPRSQ